jgi:hypothetical protein
LLLGTVTPGESVGRAVDLPVFDLAVLFERILERLVRALASRVGLTVKVQHTRQALFDGDGEVYRRIRPDIVLYDADRPVAILDAKFKPHYTSGGLQPAPRHRVSLDDAYQLFFYAERLRNLHGMDQTLPAFVVAPQLGDDANLPRIGKRTVVWRDEPDEPLPGLVVLPVPLQSIMDVFLEGGSDGDAANLATELSACVRGCPDRRGIWVTAPSR